MSPSEAKIAVLLAAYNGMLWIEEQLASIQCQAGVAVHVFIRVDPSTDGTQAWCDHYAACHSNVTLLAAAESSGGAARNFFHLIRDVEFQAFDFVAFADQDDRWHADKLARAAQYLANHTPAAYSSNVTAFWPDGSTRLLDKAQPQVEWDHYFEAAGPGCTYVLKKDFALYLQSQVREKWANLQEVTLHDWYIYALARSHGYTWHIDPIASLEYRQHPHNQVGANVGVGALLSRYRRIRSGWWFGQVKLIEHLVNQTLPSERRPRWRTLKRTQLLGLCLRAGTCRRRRRDQLLFQALCLLTAVVGARSL